MGKNKGGGSTAPTEKKAGSKGGDGKGKGVKDTSGGSGYTKVKVRHILCEKMGKVLEAQAKLAPPLGPPDRCTAR